MFITWKTVQDLKNCTNLERLFKTVKEMKEARIFTQPKTFWSCSSVRICLDFNFSHACIVSSVDWPHEMWPPAPCSCYDDTIFIQKSRNPSLLPSDPSPGWQDTNGLALSLWVSLQLSLLFPWRVGGVRHSLETFKDTMSVWGVFIVRREWSPIPGFHH